ncbi:hypothetical protein GCM10023332_20330 [Luteimonas vadosa]|uniref:DUF3300 domain-containing protein n=1 Tax=Luteimonas vadosa TaxID=1165507 RepID=A0ABP9E5B5_9GAMM
MQQQRRASQYRYQQEYYRRLLRQQAGLGAFRYRHDNPYFHAPASHRYGYGGNWYDTNRYGADLLRQAIHYGYREGYRAGRADRRDRWRYDYRSTFAYRDASFGYRHYYVGRRDYQYYFRQGFRRGYDDGYASRYRYGRHDNGSANILQNVLATILNLQVLR